MTLLDHGQPKPRLGVWAAVASDYRRYRAAGARSGVGIVFCTQGFWASAVYRFFHHVLLQARLGLFRPPLRLAAILAQKCIEIVTGISLPAGCVIGEGLYIGHFGPVVVSPQVRLGDNCNLSQCVTIGLGGRGENRGCPTLGDRVYVGPGAIIFGPIQIGDDAAIGAGAIVTRDAPARAVLAGNPAKIISLEGSFEFVRYEGMEDDPQRRMALAQRGQLPATAHVAERDETGAV